MNVSSVTVWYNPDETCVRNVLSYSSAMGKCFIVDNSSIDNLALAEKIPNAVYIPNKDNLGIAKALNIGCAKAYEEGFDLCMTMDQDSFWDKDAVECYLHLVQENVNEQNVSFAPKLLCYEVKSVLGRIKGLFFKPKKNNVGNLPLKELCKRGCITSGNIIKLSVWKDVGMFYEPFFIDEVDYEFCYRLHEKGFKILSFPNILMHHTMGAPRLTFYPSGGNYKGKRLYYIFRNSSYMKVLHPDDYAKWDYKKRLKKTMCSLLFNLRWNQFFYAFRGLRDAKKHRLGRYEDIYK